MAKTKFEPRIGWWFSEGYTLPHGDGRLIVIGEKLSVKGKLRICRNALHGSFNPFDALQYAPGPWLHKVEFSGARIENQDKVGSRSRTVLARVDASDMLRHFACRQALSVAHLWNMPSVVREYLETRDETKQDAVWDAAAAARGATAAAQAAWDAAAPWDAQTAAAAAAAQAAVAQAAAWDAARQMFNAMVEELFNDNA